MLIESTEPPEQKRRRAPEERPQQILEAAFREFGERGLGGARLDDIARGAGVAKGTIYLYFPNKEALFQEMVRSSIIAALESAEQWVAQSEHETAARQLQRFFVDWWAFLRSDRFQVVHRLVMAELHNFPELLQFYADEVIARGRRLIGSLVERGTRRGEFRDIDPAVAARMLQSLAVTHTVWCSRDQFSGSLGSYSDDDVRDQLIDFYLHALRPLTATQKT